MNFRTDVEHLLNQHSLENGSDTPDFVLSEYLGDCLSAFDKAVARRERWYGRTEPPAQPEVDPPQKPFDPDDEIPF